MELDKIEILEISNKLINLVNKLEEIGNDTSFQSVFMMSQIHGAPYKGPNWEKELTEAKEVLKQYELL